MSDTVTVDVAQGTLRGRKTRSRSGRTYYSFQGVPYAKPPIGPLRFKAAEPPEPWSGVRDALKEASVCTQFNDDTHQLEGSEDSLYLNVYTPQLPADGSGELKPVMVWIHGGGFFFGSGNSDVHGPDYLVDEGVLLVTFNYRLGVLGFLCLDDPCAPGNNGLKDQVAALRWVQQNITKFSGDPTRVTIFGESAGGASVHFHMLSPMSKGLFSRAIAQSGSALNPWAIGRHPRENAFRLGKALGFNGKHPEELVEYLRGIDHLSLVKAAIEHALPEEDKIRILPLSFVPTEEIEIEGTERFLPASPTELVNEGRYHDVPYMTGVTSEEGLVVFKFPDGKSTEVLAKVDKEFNRIILPELHIPENYSKKDEIVRKVKDFYFKDAPVSQDTKDRYIDMNSDLFFLEGITSVLKKMTQFKKAPLYCYKLSYTGELNYYKIVLGINYPGVSHADDLGYLFRIKTIDSDLPIESPSSITRARMVKLWTNFAKTGNPTPEEDPLLKVQWKPYTEDNPCYLDIGEELVMLKNMFEKRMQFWEEIYHSCDISSQ